MFPSMGTNPPGQVSAACSSGTEVAVPYPASSLDCLDGRFKYGELPSFWPAGYGSASPRSLFIRNFVSHVEFTPKEIKSASKSDWSR